VTSLRTRRGRQRAAIVGLPDVPAHEVVGGATRSIVRLPAGGLVLGTDEQGTPVTIRLFGDQPTRVRMLTDGPLAQLMALRTLALGARVNVLTDQVAGWAPLLRAVPQSHSGGPPPVTVVPSAGEVRVKATAAVPLLVVRATAGGARPPQPAPWQSVVAADPIAGIGPLHLSDLSDHQLLITERVPPFAVQPIRETFGLPYDRAVWLSQLPEDRIAVVGPGQLAIVDVRRSPVEVAVLSW
jgi:ESX secretion system protein EccE